MSTAPLYLSALASDSALRTPHAFHTSNGVLSLISASHSGVSPPWNWITSGLTASIACAVGTASMLTSSSTTLTEGGMRRRSLAASSSDKCRGLGS